MKVFPNTDTPAVVTISFEGTLQEFENLAAALDYAGFSERHGEFGGVGFLGEVASRLKQIVR